MNTKEIQNRSGHALLIFHPHPGFTWRMWGKIIVGITDVFNDYEFVDCSFIVKLRGLSDIYGTGLLGYI